MTGWFEAAKSSKCRVAKAEECAWSSAGRPERPPQPKGLPHLGNPGMYKVQGQARMPDRQAGGLRQCAQHGLIL